MWIYQHQQFVFRLAHFVFQILEIQAVNALFFFKWIGHHFSAISYHCPVKSAIGRVLDYNSIAFFCKSPDCGGQTKSCTQCGNNVVWVYIPVSSQFHPVADCTLVVPVRKCKTEQSVCRKIGHSACYKLWQGIVHLCTGQHYAACRHIFCPGPFHIAVIFVTCPYIKIVFHSRNRLVLIIKVYLFLLMLSIINLLRTIFIGIIKYYIHRRIII